MTITKFIQKIPARLSLFILLFTFLFSEAVIAQTTIFNQGFEGSWKSMKNTTGITIPSGTPSNQGWSTMYSTTDSNNVIHRSDYQGAWSSNRDNCGGTYMPSSCAANSTTYSAIFNNADASGGAGMKSPTINLSAYNNGCSTVVLKFYYLNRNSNSATMNYELYYSGSWHNIQSYGGLGTGSTWTLVTYTIPTSQLTSDFRIEFYCNGNANGYPIGVDEVTITTTINMTAAITASTNVSCNGGSNGTATVTPTGGSTPYTYSWTGGKTTSSVTGLSAGTYTATVTGSTGCTATAVVTITQPTALTASAGSNKTICIGSSATIGGSPTASGGTTAYTYAWSPSAGLNNTTSANPVSSATTTTTTTYSITVTDSKGCTAIATVVVTVPTPTPSISASPSLTICTGKSTTLTASGGSTYSWSTGATTAAITVSPTANTGYTVTVTNSNGCTAKTTATVVINALPTPSISGSDIVCVGGTVLTASGGNSYAWNTGATTTSITVTPTTNTTYSVTATNGSGCTATTAHLIRTVTDLGHGNTCSNNISMTDSVKWFRFVADSQSLRIYFPSPDTLEGNILFYGGTCNSLTFINSELIQQHGNMAVFIGDDLQAGNTYWIKISTTSNPTSISVCANSFTRKSCAPPAQCNYIYNGSFESAIQPFFTGQLDNAACWKIEKVNIGSCGISPGANNSPDLFDAAVTTPQSTTCNDGNNFVDIPQNFETINTPVASPTSGSKYMGMYYGEKVSVAIQVLTQNFYVLQFNSNPGDVGCGYLGELCIDLIKSSVATSGYNICSPCALENANIHQWTPQSYCVDLTALANINQYDRIAVKAPSTNPGSSGPRQESLFDDFVLWKMADAGADVTTCSCVTIGSGCATQFANMSYSWSPSTGLSNPNVLNPDACPAVTTTYTLTATHTDPVTFNTCVAIDEVTVTVVAPPTASFTFTNELCMGNTFTFTNNYILGNTYFWDFGDGSTFNQTTSTPPTHTYTKPGQYVVLLTETNPNYSGCCDVFSALVSVTPSTISPAYNSSCCSAGFSYSNTNITYNTTQSFIGASFSVKDEMRITNNSTVTFTSSTIEFGPWGKVIIEPGSTLILLATKFTGLQSCGTMWQGIEVWGDPNHSHANATQQAFQGKLVTNHFGGVTTIIERAHNAITLGRYPEPFLPTQCNQIPPKPCYNGIYNTCSSGGILLSTGLVTSSNIHEFIDNAHNIRVAPFQFANVSTIQRCLFGGTVLRDPGYSTATSAYQYPNSVNKNYAYANPLGRTYRFGYIQNAQWTSTITFLSNRFDLSTDIGSEIGIEIVNGKCNILGNTFTNTIRGISGIYTSTSPFNGNRIKSNTFINPTLQLTNAVTPFPSAGIYLKASQGDRISNANVFGDKNLFLAQTNTPYGIFMDNSSSFLILDNEFYKAQQGIYAWNSSFNGGVIQRFDSNNPNGNFFKQCKKSIETNQNNVALKIRCNTTDNNNSGDYLVNWDNSLTVFNPLAQQGATANSSQITRPAGNRFDVSNLNTSTRKQIKSLFAYKYLSHNTYVFIPTNAAGSSVNIQVQAAQCTNFTACCPSDPCLSENPPWTCNLPHLAQLEDDLTALRAEYDSTVDILDQGNTIQLLSALDVDTSDSYIQNLLLDNSPLSDAVVESLINWSDYASASTFLEIIIPNSPVSDDLRNVLLEKLNTLPGGVAEAIYAAQSSNTYRTLTNISKDIAFSNLERQAAVTSILVFYADTDSVQTMTAFLEGENTVSADQALLAMYISQDSLDLAESKLSSMIATTDEEEAYLALQGMLLDLAQDSLNIFEMDSTQEALVRDIASMSSCVAQANACNILYIVFNESCIPDSGARHQNVSVHPEQTAFMQNVVSMGYLGNNIPNPLNNNTVIPYLLPDGVDVGFIKIYSIAGKLLHKYELNGKHTMLTISADNMENGVYIYRLETKGQILGSKKMIVIK